MSTLGADKPYHHGDLRAKLIEVGASILDEEGASALSLREVARRAGVSHAAPYRHFPDHQALLAAIAIEGFRLLQREIEHATVDAINAQDALQSALLTYLAFGQRHRHHLQLMFGTDLSSASPSLKNVAEEAFSMLVDLVGSLEPNRDHIENRKLALALWAAVHGLGQLALVLQLQELVDAENSFAAAESALDAIVTLIVPSIGKSQLPL